MRSMLRYLAKVALCLPAVLLLAAPARPDVRVTVEPRTLDAILARLTAHSAQVGVGEMQVRIVVEEIAIERMVPRSAGAEGYVQLRLRLHAPELGMRLPLQPRLYFEVVGQELELTFRDVTLALPTGAIDVSKLMPTLRYPAETLFQLDGVEGAVALRTTVSDIFVAPDGLRIVLDVGAD